MEKQTLSLTRDELLVLMRIMDWPTLNGLGDDPFAQFSQRELTERLNCGIETLLQRGLVERRGEDLSVNNTLIAFVGLCLIPEAALLLSQIRPDDSVEPHYFYATSHLIIEHSSPRPGIYYFTQWPSLEALEARVQELLVPLQTSNEVSSSILLQISDQTLAEVLKSFKQNDATVAKQKLHESSWPAAAVEAFAATCADGFSLWVGRTVWGMRQEIPAGDKAAMVIVGGQQQWLATPEDDEPTHLVVQTASGEDCVQALTRLLMPLKDAYKQLQSSGSPL